MHNDTIAAIVAGALTNLVLFAFTYGKLSEKVISLKESYDALNKVIKDLPCMRPHCPTETEEKNGS